MVEPCRRCGHPLGAGRYCTNCGEPVAPPESWRTDTAERRAVPGRADEQPAEQPAEQPDEQPDRSASAPARSPLPPVQPPSAPRFPLYADQADPSTRGDDDADRVEDDGASLLPLDGAAADAPRRRGGLLPWVVGAVVVVLIAAAGGVLLLRGGDDTAPDASGSPPAATGTGRPGGASSAPASPAPSSPRSSPPSSPRGTPRPPRTPPRSSRPVDVARSATATAPPSAPPGTDVDGNVVPYTPANMLDGVPSTAWRMVGDGTGSLIVVRLAAPTTLRSVGLINGYAKSEPGYDGYPANRRITAVQWIFDGGRTVSQSLRPVRALQSIPVPRVRTRSVSLRIVSVSRPGAGRSGRDYTAISDLSLVGVPG